MLFFSLMCFNIYTNEVVTVKGLNAGVTFEHFEHSARAVQKGTEREWKPTSKKKIMVEWKIEKESRKKRVCSYLRNRSYLFTKRSSELKFGGIFFSNTDCHSCHRRFPVSFPLPSYCLCKFTFLKSKWLAFMFFQKDHDLFYFFAFFTHHERDRWHMKYERFYVVVCLFFLLSPK